MIFRKCTRHIFSVLEYKVRVGSAIIQIRLRIAQCKTRVCNIVGRYIGANIPQHDAFMIVSAEK